MDINTVQWKPAANREAEIRKHENVEYGENVRIVSWQDEVKTSDGYA